MKRRAKRCVFAPSQFLCIPYDDATSFTGTTKHAHSPPYRKCKLYLFIYLLYFDVLTWIKPNGAENQAEDERDNEVEGDGDDDDDDDDDDSDDEYVEEEDDAAPSVLSKKRSIDEVVDKEAHGSKKIKA